MVGRQSSFLVTKRSLRNSEAGGGKRPRRLVPSKNLDDTMGLSRREEQELNKALYASLQENKRSKTMSEFFELVGSSSIGHSSIGNSSKNSIKSHRSSSENSLTSVSGSTRSHVCLSASSIGKLQGKPQTRKHSWLLSHRLPPTRLLRQRDSTASLSVDDSSQDSLRSSTSSHNGSKRKIHAQRKFAQGCTLPGMVSCSPVKVTAPAVKMMTSKVPKTEDFLTFLCLRGSSVLPPHLDFFNFSRDREVALLESTSQPAEPDQREGTPESSSTSSGPNEEVAEAASVSTPINTNRNAGGSLTKRSAARASAGTPETARGIVSLRQGLQRKVSPSSSSVTGFPVSPSRLLPVSALTNSSHCHFRNKFYFTPQKSLSPSKASGIRPGEFTPPSLSASASSMSSACRFSPLVYCPSKFGPIEVGSPDSLSCSASPASLPTSPICGAPKRKRQFSVSSQPTPTKKSPHGAFSPVGGHNSSKTASRTPTRETNRSRSLPMMSARKSLFGKSTSIAQQQAKKIVGKSTRQSSSWSGSGQLKTTRSHDNPSRLRSLNTAVRKRKRDADDKIDKRNSNAATTKKLKKDSGVHRRVSTRLREMSRSIKGKSSWRDSDRVSHQRVTGRDNQGSSSSTQDSPEQFIVPSHSASRDEKARASSSSKPRKPYKIQPPERVRTRAYSMLLASKLALKRAKRENVAIRMKTRTDAAGNVEKASRRKREVDSRRRPPFKIGSGGQKQSSLSSKRADGDDDADNAAGNRGKTVSERTQKTGSSQGLSSGQSTTLRSNKVTTERSRMSTKLTPPQKGKNPSSSPKTVPLSRPTSSEENSVPTFSPTEAEFSDPLTYINKIQSLAEPFGMCRIIPPPSWKLDSNKISDDIRFTSQVQHTHRLFQRWGPNVQLSAAINHHLLSDLSNVTTTPQIGGIEIDLPQLYHLVEESGGVKKMNDKKHWSRVADIMNIPKQAMDRTMRLYDIYCRHIFPYATLSAEERKQLEDEVGAIHDLQVVEDEAIIRGKSMPVNWFNRIARNVQSLCFKEEPTVSQLESRYWQIVEERTKHIAVQCGHIDTRAQASAFPTRRDSTYTRHPWNLNNILENPECVLKYLGPVSGVTVPTLHMNMLFSTSCWSSDPHCLPYVQYVHTGADIIWYCIPKSQHSRFRAAMTELTPSLVSEKPKWLKEDCVMVNPQLLRNKGLKVSRCVQSPRQFVVVFPGAFTATISCGYSVAESVHYATSHWLPLGMEAAKILSTSGEKEMFSMSCLLCGLVQDISLSLAALSLALPLFSAIVSRELELRTQLQSAGLRGENSAVFAESPLPSTGGFKKRLRAADEEKICDICDKICFLSMVLNEQDEQVLCLDHAVKHVQRRKHLKSTRFFLRYNQVELETMLARAKERLAASGNKTNATVSSQDKTKTPVSSQDKTKTPASSQDKTKLNVSSQDKTKTPASSQDKTKTNVSLQDKTKLNISSQEKIKATVSSQEKTKATVSTQDKTKANGSTQDKAKATVSSQDKTKSTISSQDKPKAAISSQEKTKTTVSSQEKTKAATSLQDKAKAAIKS